MAPLIAKERSDAGGSARIRRVGFQPMRGLLVTRALLGPAVAAALLFVVVIASSGAARASAPHCPQFGRPAIATDPRPGALRVFAIQFEQHPADMVSAASFKRAIDCVMRLEVAPYLAKGRPNLVVFDEDNGLETMAIGPRGAKARHLLHHGTSSCQGKPFPCETLAGLSALDKGYGRALNYLEARFPNLSSQLGRAFVAATDEFARTFMGTMATAARRYHVYLVASNSQAPFRLTRNPQAVAALRDPATPNVKAVYAPTVAHVYDQAFLWGPKDMRRHAPPPLANLLASNRKVPLTSFEQALGFYPGPSRGPEAVKNLEPFRIPGTKARLGFATSLPAFVYGSAQAPACHDVSETYMRCLDHLGANVLIQADANDGAWSGPDGGDSAEHWQPMSWMGSAWRAVSDPTVGFDYAINTMMVGNLADTPFDGQSAILERGLIDPRHHGQHPPGCHYVGNGAFFSEQDDPALRAYAGSKTQFLAMAPWVVSGRSRSAMVTIGNELAAGQGPYHYEQTALIADLDFPVDRTRIGCVMAGRSG
jgi:hypothetical protein